MYSKLPLKFVGITDNFGLRTHPITGVSTYHYGVDFGWNKYQGEPVLLYMRDMILRQVITWF